MKTYLYVFLKEFAHYQDNSEMSLGLHQGLSPVLAATAVAGRSMLRRQACS